MKPIYPYAFLGALFAVGALNAATTTPVGYVSLGDTTPGQAAVKANTEVTISVPLLRPAVNFGKVASVSGAVITLVGEIPAGEYNAPADGAPFLVEVTSGAKEGLFVLISSNTATEITVALGGGGDLGGVAVGDSIAIRPAWTLGTLLPSESLPDGVQLAAFDVQPSINNSASPLYLNNSGFGGWIDGATFMSAANAVLYPGESFVLINNTNTPIQSLIVSGEVPTSKSMLQISKDGAGAQDTRIGYVGPVSEILDEAGFDPAEGDQILAFDQTQPGINKSASQVLIYNPGFGGWIDGATFTPVGDSFTLDGGKGYIYRRSASAPVGDQIISDQQSYLDTL